ncbi:hypothetical protein GTA08_BOTSDO12203 [Neofusicoccum parvum]|uniref:Uncharacterized protein n=1 Tax=Neofusicoccum parvum TaxID=310453 RepID=A0ACB5SIU3_9PEZI|nr:hypothetical protein GTA08_BOTSDO12203 [Neofusicoccum parvum]
MSSYNHSSPRGAGGREGHGSFVPPPQAYQAPPPVNHQQQLQPYQHGTHDNTSLAPWTAPPAQPYRGESYNSQRSHHSHRSRRSHHSDDDEYSSSRRHRYNERRPTIGASLYWMWDLIVGAIRSPSGKRA